MSTIQEIKKTFMKHFNEVSIEKQKEVTDSPQSLKRYLFRYLNEVNPSLIMSFLDEFFHYDIRDEIEIDKTYDEGLMEAYSQFIDGELYLSEELECVDDMIEELYASLIC